MARGRKSAISLAVMPPALPGEKPAPPAELDAVEERIWRATSALCRRPGSMPPPSRSWSGQSRRRPFARVRRRSCALSAPKSIRTPTQLALWRPSTPLPEKIFRICSES